MFKTLLYQPLLQTLLFLAAALNNNLGLAIIALTLLLKGILFPFSLPSLRSFQKIRELKPQLDQLKQRHQQDKLALQKAQLNLYQQHGINPAAGCLPNIFQFVVLIALYNVFIDFLRTAASTVNTRFLWLDLTAPDPYYALPLLAGFIQLLLSLMLAPAIEHHPEKNQRRTEDVQDMAETMQQQMLVIMPIMTVIIALRFPSGLALYWVVSTLFSLFQQYFVSGLGGLESYLLKLKLAFRPKA